MLNLVSFTVYNIQIGVPFAFQQVNFISVFVLDMTVYFKVFFKKRLAYAIAFSFSYLSQCTIRNSKPFNPLLGETWEYKHKDFKIVTEQVSHHPPISASNYY